MLFHLEGNTIVDESDAFFGPGNNGRNCIQKSLNYEYSLVDCFYQNNQKAYTAPQYLEGTVNPPTPSFEPLVSRTAPLVRLATPREHPFYRSTSILVRAMEVTAVEKRLTH